jgi:hypothetical protein
MDLTDYPNLITPTALAMTPSALNVTVSAPSPFAVLVGNAALTTANGTSDGAVSYSYAVNLSSLIPGYGSVVAYGVASFAQVQDTPYNVIGPPSGHPDYNPAFAPYQAYARTKGILAITATTVAPDNLTTLELCRW